MKLIAHRGASKEAPENSLAAIQRAIELGADMIEIDVMLSADDIPVVTHYDDLSRLFQRPGAVRDTKTADLVKLGIPTLATVLELLRHTAIPLILDIKAQSRRMYRAPAAIARISASILPPEQILLSSFYFRHHLVLRKNFSRFPRGIILYRGPFKLVPLTFFDRFFQVRSVHPPMQGLSALRVREWQDHGFKVYPWVANRPDEIRLCQKLGVDGIFTDDLKLAKQTLAVSNHGGTGSR